MADRAIAAVLGGGDAQRAAGGLAHAGLEARGELSRAAGLSIGLRLGKAVAALHRAGVIHRDIKPANVLLEESGGVE